MMADAALDKEEKGLLIDMIVTEDDPDARGILSALLAFREAEVDLERGPADAAAAARLDASGMFEKEEIGAGMYRYSF